MSLAAISSPIPALNGLSCTPSEILWAIAGPPVVIGVAGLVLGFLIGNNAFGRLVTRATLILAVVLIFYSFASAWHDILTKCGFPLFH